MSSELRELLIDPPSVNFNWLPAYSNTDYGLTGEQREAVDATAVSPPFEESTDATV